MSPYYAFFCNQVGAGLHWLPAKTRFARQSWIGLRLPVTIGVRSKARAYRGSKAWYLVLQRMTDSTDGCAIGLDVGTSQCRVAGKRRTGQTTIGHGSGDRASPAYVGLDSDNDLMCGTEVKEDYHQSSNGFAFGIKRLLKKNRSCKTNYDQAARLSLQNSNAAGLTLEKCFSHILKELRNDAVQVRGNENITSAVITVPHVFDQQECQVVSEAAESTGCFKQVHLVAETQAAAIAYVEENNVQIPEKNVLVLNYGGGFLEGSFFPELSKDCLKKFGDYDCKTMSAAVGAGEEFTQAIMDHLRDRVVKECDGVQIEESHALRHEFRMKSEGLKKSMRSGTAVPFSFMDVKPDTDFTGSFTPEDFNKCTEDLLKTVEHELKSFARVTFPHKVESIVLTGGSTRMSLFKDKRRRVFPHAVLKETIIAEEAAAIGAVIVAQHILPEPDGCSPTYLVTCLAPQDKNTEAAEAVTAIGAQQVSLTSDNSEVRTLARNVATPDETGEAANTVTAQPVPSTSDKYGRLKQFQEIATHISIKEAEANGTANAAHSIKPTSSDGGSQEQVKEKASHFFCRA